MSAPHTSVSMHDKCRRDGHNFTEVFKSDEYVVVSGNTEVYRTFLCTQCGDTVRRFVVLWRDFVPKKKGVKL